MAKAKKNRGQEPPAVQPLPETRAYLPNSSGGNDEDLHRQMMMMFEQMAASGGDEAPRQPSKQKSSQTKAEELARAKEAEELARAEAAFLAALEPQQGPRREPPQFSETDRRKQLNDRLSKIEAERSSRWERIPAKPKTETTEDVASNDPQKAHAQLDDIVYNNAKYADNLENNNNVDVAVPSDSLATDFLSTPLAEQIREAGTRNRTRQIAEIQNIKTLINNFVKTVPQNTLEEKKRLSEWINAELAQFGLAVECPDTPGLPVEMKGDRGNRPITGRFQFYPLATDGERKRPKSRDVLPELNLIPLTNSVNLALPLSPRSTGNEL